MHTIPPEERPQHLAFGRGPTGAPQPILRAKLGEDWITERQLTVQGARVVVAAIRVYPARWRNAPERSYEQAGVEAEVPPGGITARLLRRIRMGAHLDHFGATLRPRRQPGQTKQEAAEAQETAASIRQLVGHFTSSSFAAGRWHSRAAIPQNGRRRPGRRPLADAAIAEAAAGYVLACRRRSPHPIRDTARASGMTEARLRDLVYRARNRRGFLSETAQGSGGGDMTPVGRAQLKKTSAGRVLLRRLQRRTTRRKAR
jgi:hypothetical protein